MTPRPLNSLSALLLTVSVSLMGYTWDGWRAARLTMDQVRAAEFRRASAAALMPHVAQLQRIALSGIHTAADEQLARDAATILAADISLMSGGADVRKTDSDQP